MESENTYSVIQSIPKIIYRKQLVNVFKQYYGYADEIAERNVRNCWGVIAEGKTNDEASVIQKICSENGVETIVIQEKEKSVLPIATQCISVNCLPDELQYTTAAQLTNSVRWDTLILICAATVNEEKNTTISQKEGRSISSKVTSGIILLTTGLPITLGKNEEKTKEVKEIIETKYLELFLNREPYRLKIVSNNFNYSYLGKRKQYSSLLNFKILINDVNMFSPIVLKNYGFTEMLNKENVPLRYESYDYLQKEFCWLLTLMKIGKIQN